MNPLLLAAVSEPAPPGQSSSLGIAIILLCLAAGVVLAVFAAVGRRGDRYREEPRNASNRSATRADE